MTAPRSSRIIRKQTVLRLPPIGMPAVKRNGTTVSDAFHPGSPLGINSEYEPRAPEFTSSNFEYEPQTSGAHPSQAPAASKVRDASRIVSINVASRVQRRLRLVTGNTETSYDESLSRKRLPRPILSINLARRRVRCADQEPAKTAYRNEGKRRDRDRILVRTVFPNAGPDGF